MIVLILFAICLIAIGIGVAIYIKIKKDIKLIRSTSYLTSIVNDKGPKYNSNNLSELKGLQSNSCQKGLYADLPVNFTLGSVRGCTRGSVRASRSMLLSNLDYKDIKKIVESKKFKF